MNPGKQPILVVNQACDCTVTQITNKLSQAGYSVVQSFDLHSVLDIDSICLGQMVVLLVYGQDGPPATLIVSGNNSNTSVYLEKDTDRSSRSKFITLFSKISLVDKLNQVTHNQSADIETSPDC